MNLCINASTFAANYRIDWNCHAGIDGLVTCYRIIYFVYSKDKRTVYMVRQGIRSISYEVVFVAINVLMFSS